MTYLNDPIISKAIEFAKQDPDICILWLYGSHAKGTATQNSDYDFAVAFNSFLKEPLEKRTRPELLAIDWQNALSMPDFKISVVDINIAPIHLAAEIINTGTVLIKKDALRLYREENRISGMLELDCPKLAS